MPDHKHDTLAPLRAVLIKTNVIGANVLGNWLKFFTSKSERFANISTAVDRKGLSTGAFHWKRCQVYLRSLREWARKGSAGS